jgi:uncharacterized membrane protein YkgB
MFTPLGGEVSTGEELFSLFKDTRLYAVSAGLGLIAVIILVLSFYGKLGKNL